MIKLDFLSLSPLLDPRPPERLGESRRLTDSSKELILLKKNRFFLSLPENSENSDSSIRDSLNRGNPTAGTEQFLSSSFSTWEEYSDIRLT